MLDLLNKSAQPTRAAVTSLAWVALLACAGEPPRQQDSSSNRASDVSNTPVPTPTAANAIKGIWWSAEQPQSAAFQIKDSTIYFPDSFVEFRYELKGDTLLLHRDDGDVRWIITRVTADTLVVAMFERQDTYTRAEPTKP